MGWNGNSESVSSQKKPDRSRSRKRGIFAGLIVVIGAFAVYYLICNHPIPVEKQKDRTPKRQQVKEVRPAPSQPIDEPEMITNRRGQVVKKIVEKTYRDERGILRYEGGARVFDRSKRRPPIKAMNNDPFPKLNSRSDYEIATLLTIQPGMSLHGSVDYDEDFKQSFINSLVNKNEPTEGDTEWDKDLKATIEETKKELADRIRAGEDLATILTEARQEVQRLATYKRDINNLISETMRNPEATEQDIKDTVEAANKMLESNGIAPFTSDSFIRGRTRMFAAEQKKLERMRQEGKKVEP